MFQTVPKKERKINEELKFNNCLSLDNLHSGKINSVVYTQLISSNQNVINPQQGLNISIDNALTTSNTVDTNSSRYAIFKFSNIPILLNESDVSKFTLPDNEIFYPSSHLLSNNNTMVLMNHKIVEWATNFNVNQNT